MAFRTDHQFIFNAVMDAVVIPLPCISIGIWPNGTRAVPGTVFEPVCHFGKHGMNGNPSAGLDEGIGPAAPVGDSYSWKI